jgi:predicted regulator of Ras-like GTPase activity (Roadblock/LC7/MglB family)
MRMVAPPSGIASKPAAPAPSAVTPAPRPKSDEPPLTLPLASLIQAWPEDICGEIAALDPNTTVTLDAGGITAGLAKGRVLFTWGEILAGLQPAPTEATLADENTTLQLPLKIVAPAYLAATKKEKAERKSVTLDESIPALFNDSRGPAPTPVDAAPAAPEAEEAPIELAPEPLPEPEPAPLALATPVEEPVRVPQTVGEIFGEPTKEEFTPTEIIAGTVKLPGVAGAIVALQEGLPVAHSLAEGIKSEVIAAFLPQIFARLNQYSGEMKLGEVDDLLFTTHGAHCQIYRLGFVYFAVLGKPGEGLPWHELRLISAELARQTNK